MANKNITMLQLRSILQQKSLGKSNRQIAKFLHLSRQTVNGYIQQFQQLGKTIEALLKLNDEELWSLFQKEVPEVKKTGVLMIFNSVFLLYMTSFKNHTPHG